MLYGEGNINFPPALLGILAAGASCALPTYQTAVGLPFYLEKLGVYTVLCAPEVEAEVQAAARKVGIPQDRVFVVDESFEGTGGSSTLGSCHWSSLLESPGSDHYQRPRLSPEEAKETVAVFFQTSGTTGSPKLVGRTHYELVGNVEQMLFWYHLQPRGKEVFFCTFKFCGIVYFMMGLMAPLKARYQTVFSPKHQMPTFLAALDRFKPTWAVLPKYAIHEILDYPGPVDCSSIHTLTTGACHIPFSLSEEWQTKHRSPLFNAHGMSEGGCFFLRQSYSFATDDSIGALLPNMEGIVVNEKGQPLARNQTGEIWARCPFFMRGYYQDAQETAKCLTPDGWLKTGDIGWVNDQDQWYISGRLKDQYLIGGLHVSGNEMEVAMRQHPDIVDVSVIPVKLPHERDNVPRAYLVQTPGANLTVDELLGWMNKECSPAVYPRGGAVFIEKIPISTAGNCKVDQKALIERAKQELLSEPVRS
ncbi:putative AMP-binding enzyme [Aspergillus steynii IBT 23096]|uniref:Putative AMP-binding enzyme n=1 Tax=Aspergillus steynii IBT 23096 TaxID=1392250 RepID=A0A2I2FT13_9EURO|nr:putative AMP-binding enzyme [Aspergillus steynii IBT 23096]PLB43756.1 putative AMP-binding enzyme [Aspergillus steynii IBT 23096]